jgi:ABC-type transporter Mla maintaining outer membrane lipid asymmetry ATPase subunit MlaF
MVAPRPVLAAEDLAVRAGARRLWHAGSFELYEGERVLLVGPSGAGKSLFGDLLLGFVGPHSPGLSVSGRLCLDGTDLLSSPEAAAAARAGPLGAVFQMQRSGLFDDLTVEQNLGFGSRDAQARAQVARDLRLGDTARSVTLCSGGEGVRVGLARTLLHGADVIVYDEPTTGLDPVNVRQVVEAIHASHRRLSLVITHDYAAFAEFADVILFLDPVSRSWQRLPPGPETFARLHEALQHAGDPPAEAREVAPSLAHRLLAGWKRAALGTTEVLLDWLSLLLVPLTFLRAADPIDGPRIRAALRRDLAPGVLFFVGLSAILVAVTGTWFLFERLPKRVWTEPLIQEDILTGLGLLLVRVGLPLLVSVLLAAKLGAAAAAHLGHMSLTRQLDALDLLGVSRRRHLLLPTAAGQLAAACIATLCALALAYLTSLVVFLGTHPGFSARYFQDAFLREIHQDALLWVLAKVAVSAVGVAAVAYRVGTAPKRSPSLVVHGIHRTLLRALLLVLGVHAVFAFLEF